MSSSLMMRCSSPSILTSVPEYLPNRIRSPALTSRGMSFPVLGHFTLSNSNDFAFLGFLFRGVRDNNSPLCLLLLFQSLHNDSVL